MNPVIEWLESPESDTWRRFNVRPVYHHLGGGRATSEVPMPLAQILPQPERGHRQFSGRGLRAEGIVSGKGPVVGCALCRSCVRRWLGELLSHSAQLGSIL